MQTNEYDVIDGERVITKHSKVKCLVVNETKAKSIQPLVKANVKSGSNLTSDEWYAYRGLSSDYNHHVVDHEKGQYMNELGYTSNARG